MEPTYVLPDQYAGKTLSQIRDLTGAAFRPDILEGFLGIGQNQPLTQGQFFTISQLPENYRNSGESQALKSIFSQGPTVQARQEEAALTARNKVIAPAVQSLEASIPETQQKFQTERTRLTGEIEPLKQRYQSLLDQIKGKEQRQVETAQTAASREFGQRGIPASSTAYADYLAGRVNPIQSEFSNLYTQTGLEQESGLRGLQNQISGLVPQEVESQRMIRNAIASLQSGAGNSALEDAFRQLTFQESQRQFNQQQASQSQWDSLNRQIKEAELSAATRTEPTKLAEAKSGSDTYLYNPYTGQVVNTLRSQLGGGSSGNSNPANI